MVFCINRYNNNYGVNFSAVNVIAYLLTKEYGADILFLDIDHTSIEEMIFAQKNKFLIRSLDIHFPCKVTALRIMPSGYVLMETRF